METQHIGKVFAALLFLSNVAQAVTTTPLVTDRAFFDRVRMSVVKVFNLADKTAGTGFQFLAPSGKPYILTNHHVCDPIPKDLMMEVETEAGLLYKTRILKISDQADLCLLEAAPGVHGLELGPEPRAGDYLMVVGHPNMKPTQIKAGIMIRLAPYTTRQDARADYPCTRAGERKGFVPVGTFNPVFKEVCYSTYMANQTNLPVYPGNSGSPVVNLAGKVVGIAYASDLSTHREGAVVPMAEIQNFVTGY